MCDNYKILSIEGNIGSGKSTLLENLRQHYSQDSHIIFLKEPVYLWEKIMDNNGNNIIQKFYNDQEKYSFAFQMMAYISRLKILRDAVSDINKKELTNNTFIIITERSLYTDKYVFAQMLYDQKKIEDVFFKIYLSWFEEFSSDFQTDYHIYINATPQTCYDRIHKRMRIGEESIPMSYLEDCKKYHDNFLDLNNGIIKQKLTLNGNMDIYEDSSVLNKWIQQIDLLVQDFKKNDKL